MPGPPLLSEIPPDQGLALAPRLAIRVGRGPVVEDPPVGRPGPAPFRGHPVLLAAGLTPGRLVDPAGVDAAVDPAAAGGGSVVGELLVGGQWLPAGAAAVDLRQHRLGIRLGVLTRG